MVIGRLNSYIKVPGGNGLITQANKYKGEQNDHGDPNSKGMSIKSCCTGDQKRRYRLEIEARTG